MINSQNMLYITRIKTEIKTKKCNRVHEYPWMTKM